MASRGILYIVWNRSANPALEATLARSIASVKHLHPDLPIHIHEAPCEAGLLYKAGMSDLSPFEQTLFLDADTVVLDRLDFGFDAAARTSHERSTHAQLKEDGFDLASLRCAILLR